MSCPLGELGNGMRILKPYRVTVATLWLGWWLWLCIYSGTWYMKISWWTKLISIFRENIPLEGIRKSGWANFSGPWGCFPQTFVVWTLSVTEGMCLCLDLREIKRSQWSSLEGVSRKLNYAQRQHLNSWRFENPMTRVSIPRVFSSSMPKPFPLFGRAPNFCQWSFNLSKAAQFENKMWNNLCRKRNFRYEER